MQKPVVGMLWPTAENFDRFLAVCADPQSSNIEAWHARADAKIKSLEPMGIEVIKLEFGPDDLADWAKKRGSSVDSNARQLFAAELMAKRSGR